MSHHCDFLVETYQRGVGGGGWVLPSIQVRNLAFWGAFFSEKIIFGMSFLVRTQMDIDFLVSFWRSKSSGFRF